MINDVPISTGNENDALLTLVDGKWVVLRVPYPLSFYAKGMDGRIDDLNAGWKGRGVWTTSGDRAPWLKEGGKGYGSDRLSFPIPPQPARQLIALKTECLTSCWAPRLPEIPRRRPRFRVTTPAALRATSLRVGCGSMTCRSECVFVTRTAQNYPKRELGRIFG